MLSGDLISNMYIISNDTETNAKRIYLILTQAMNVTFQV